MHNPPRSVKSKIINWFRKLSVIQWYCLGLTIGGIIGLSGGIYFTSEHMFYQGIKHVRGMHEHYKQLEADGTGAGELQDYMDTYCK
jgi:hypothetical protein